MNQELYERMKELSREFNVVLGVWSVEDIAEAIAQEEQPETDEQTQAITAQANELWNAEFKAALQQEVNNTEGLMYFIAEFKSRHASIEV